MDRVIAETLESWPLERKSRREIGRYLSNTSGIRSVLSLLVSGTSTQTRASHTNYSSLDPCLQSLARNRGARGRVCTRLHDHRGKGKSPRSLLAAP